MNPKSLLTHSLDIYYAPQNHNVKDNQIKVLSKKKKSFYSYWNRLLFTRKYILADQIKDICICLYDFYMYIKNVSHV